MCIYFADTGYELDAVLSPQKEQPCLMPADPKLELGYVNRATQLSTSCSAK